MIWVLPIGLKRFQKYKRLNPETTSEVLIPDFQGRSELIQLVIDAKPDIISHNMETVRRISPLVRSAANYATSLKVIKQIANNGITAKSGIMVGLGERPEEVEEVMDDLLAQGCKNTYYWPISTTHPPPLSGSGIYYPRLNSNSIEQLD